MPSNRKREREKDDSKTMSSSLVTTNPFFATPPKIKLGPKAASMTPPRMMLPKNNMDDSVLASVQKLDELITGYSQLTF